MTFVYVRELRILSHGRKEKFATFTKQKFISNLEWKEDMNCISG